MPNRSYEALRITTACAEPVTDDVTVEAPLQININTRPFTITMRTPGDDRDLVKGLMFTEGVVKAEGLNYEFEQVSGNGQASVVNLSLPDLYVCDDMLEKRSLISSASCGLCGKQELADIHEPDQPLEPRGRFDAALIPAMTAAMHDRQVIFRRTGGCHAAAAFTLDGHLLCAFEDVGRHNAVDKVIGWLLTHDRMDAAEALMVSGRISFEIAIKAHRAGMPFLLAVSAPSSLAIDFAERTGMTLIGFCRDGRATVYSHRERVLLATATGNRTLGTA